MLYILSDTTMVHTFVVLRQQVNKYLPLLRFEPWTSQTNRGSKCQLRPLSYLTYLLRLTTKPFVTKITTEGSSSFQVFLLSVK